MTSPPIVATEVAAEPHLAGVFFDDCDTVCRRQGETDRGFRGAHLNPLGLFLNPLGLFLRTSIPFVWCALCAFLRA
jgi:hypothetical protein